MIFLSGILVDLVPFGDRFWANVPEWENGPAAYWASAGERMVLSHATVDRWRQHRQDNDNHGVLSFGMQTKSGTPIGEISLNWVSAHHRSTEIGISIGNPAYWGGGYGTDALLLVVEYAFEWLDLRRIIVETMALNERVQRQMDKTGFTLEARRLSYWYVGSSAWSDTLIYGMQREEWPGRAALVERLGLKPHAAPEA
ncbi:MAG TPA: GNAT family protein [Aggregatilinea sp.]|uniref:GNAT family N-acetyltransferase n=1 Tax=Aggregatilinea sp. TaxID=2806333 RepID=UPI002BDEEE27|nr:GNAT family protein [Aggregatilinea sp.]HML24538.1 GNAT family protein [Aggregatilinea sp.]